MIDELVKTVRLHLSERLTSPLLGAFIVSWCVWNYRTLMVLLSGDAITEKFWILDKMVYDDWHQQLGVGLTYPLLTSLAYLFLYPYPAKWVYQFTRIRQREILEVRRRIEEETPLTIEDSRQLKDRMAKMEIARYEELDKKDAEIARLKTQISNLHEEIAQSQEQAAASASKRSVSIPRPDEQNDLLKAGYIRVEDDSGEIPPFLLSTLGVIAQLKSVSVRHLLIDFPSKHEFELEFALDELERLGKVTSSVEDDGIRYYSLTHEGRGTLIRAREAKELRAAMRAPENA